MLELSERGDSNRFGKALIFNEENDIIVSDQRRRCTDMFCLILFIGFCGTFIGFLIYSLIKGDIKSVFGIYNANGNRCDATNFNYGFFPIQNSLQNAICVASCPTSENPQVSCLPQSPGCPGETLTSTYPTIALGIFCIPDVGIDGFSLCTFFDYNVYEEWAYDLKEGYLILIGAAIASMVASLLFLCFIRCCAKFVVWSFILIGVACLLVLGVFCIMQSQGVHISPFITYQLARISHNALIIVGSVCLGAGVLLLLIVFCLSSRINQGTKAVELSTLFILECCYMVLMPISQAIFLTATFAALIIGAIYLYSIGTPQLNSPQAFPIIEVSTPLIIMLSFFGAGALWTLFWIHGSNHFVVASSACVWYFNHQRQQRGNPLSDSFDRLVKYHSGTVAFSSLVNGLFFILKFLANLFSFSQDPSDGTCTKVCVRCMNCIFCIFSLFLRFLSDGTYVQVAIFAKGYCHSTLASFELIANNGAKVAVTHGISIFFTILGIIGISVGVAVAAYFCSIQIQYFAAILTDPIAVTVVSGIIAFVVSCIYLSLIDLSAQAIIESYLVDHTRHAGKPRHCRDAIKQIIVIEV